MPDAVELATHEWLPSRTDATTAPLAVLVHGLTGWHRTWWRVGPGLAERGWRVVAVDQRGHGTSPRIDGYATVAELAADLAQVVRSAGSPADVIIGHSLGAAVTAEMALAEPALVRRVVLEDPPSVNRADDPSWLEALETDIRAAVTDPEAAYARDLAENPAWLEGDARQEVDGRQLADLEGLRASFGRGVGHRVLDIAPKLTVRALYLLASDEESAMPAPAQQQLRETAPANVRIVKFECGHTIHRDRFDDYMAAVLGWLDPASASVGGG